MPLYPRIDVDFETTLKVLVEQITAEPGYLQHKDCPYTKDVKAILKVFEIDKSSAGQGSGEGRELIDNPNLLLDEILDTYEELIANKPTSKDDDAAAMMSYFRTRTSLLEKLVSIREETMNAAKFIEFRRIILSLMEEYLTPEQRSELLSRLKKADGNG